MTAIADAQPERLAVTFGRVLRGHGVGVALTQVATYAEALTAVDVTRRASVYWAGRATLLTRPEDAEGYDTAFASFWLRHGRGAGRAQQHPPVVTFATDDETNDPEGAVDPEVGGPLPGAVFTVRYSPQEVLRHKDFAVYTHAEFDEARRLIADLRLAGAFRRSRRLRPAASPTSRRRHPDVRRTVRAALRSGGEPFRRAFLEPGRRPRRVVLLCDVSGSMEPYSRALLRFLHAAVAGRSQVEAFALGTRLTRITRPLSSRDPDAALARAARSVVDWSGGTRLGEGLRAFNDQWGTRGMARGAVVVILSDGWDRGEPELLAEQMARLSRVAYRVVWVNPLKAAPGYAPLARGMAAALPWVDEFVEGHSLASLETLVGVISR